MVVKGRIFFIKEKKQDIQCVEKKRLWGRVFGFWNVFFISGTRDVVLSTAFIVGGILPLNTSA